MASERPVLVHLVPALAAPARFKVASPWSSTCCGRRPRSFMPWRPAAVGGPCGEVEEARTLADGMRRRQGAAGRRTGRPPLAGLRPGQFARRVHGQGLQGHDVVLTTTNGTRALLRAAGADRVLVAGFVNYSAVCEQLRADPRPLHIICAGTDGEVSAWKTRCWLGRWSITFAKSAKYGSTTRPGWPGMVSRTTAGC